MMSSMMQGREVIFEFHKIGPYIKVTAMDTKTMTEIVIQGPASAGEATLKLNAMKRLEYVLKKKGLV